MNNDQSNTGQREKVQRLFAQLALLPIPLLLVTIAVLWGADLQVVWHSPTLYWLVHYGSATIGIVFIAIPAARTFVANGQPNVLMLGCGVLMMEIGTAALPTGGTRSTGTGFAIYNTSVLLSALCHFAGVAINSRSKTRLRNSAAWLTAAYTGGTAAMGLVIWLALTGRMPVFFIDGRGGTLLRTLVIGAAAALFLLTSGLLWQTNRRRASSFLRWYALGLVLLAAGLCGSMLIVVKDSPLQWVTRFTQLFGLIYMCVAILTSARASSGSPLAAVEEVWREKEFLAGLRQQTPLGFVLRYGLAVAAVAAGMGLRLALMAWAGPGLPTYITFYPAIMVVALLAGFGPGLAATVLADVVVGYWIIPPIGQFSIASPVDRLGLILFTSMGLFMSIVAELHRRNRDKAAAYDREAALRDSQARLAAFAKASFEGIVESEAGRIVDCNEQLARIMGYSVAELKGLEITSLIPLEDRDRVMENILSGRDATIEHRMLCKDGSRIIVEVHGQPMSQGSAKRHTTIRNVTDRKRAEEALRRKEADLSEAQRLAHIGSWHWDAKTDITTGSDELLRIYGLDPATQTMPTFSEQREWCYPVADWERVNAAVQDTMRTGIGYELDVEAISNGTRRWVTTRGEAVRDADGQIVGLRGTVQDIDDRKRAETELYILNQTLEDRVAERTDEAEQRALQLRQLAAELTLAEQRERQRISLVLHDGLQQILVAAKFHIALLGKTKDVPRLTAELTEMIDNGIETSRSLTAELSPPILRQGGLVLALEWLVGLMRDKHGLTVRLTSHAKIESAPEEVVILLFQSVRELLFNAAKHAGVRMARVEIMQEAGRIRVDVEDEGVGFDPMQLIKEGAKSRGMGLFSIQERLSYLGGSLEIDSAPGRGSRFKLITPQISMGAAVLPSYEQSIVSISVTSQRDTAVGSGKRVRIVLVDDHMVMRQGLAGLLRAEPDIEIVGEASDGQSAVELIRELRPDVVLMDISMPGMDGIQATRILHKELPEVRIIGLSMFQEGERQAAMREAGAVDYLTKTGPSVELIDAIRKCMVLQWSKSQTAAN